MPTENQMITVIYGHPWDKSFNHAILDTVLAALTKANVKHTLIDLYADKFDPAVRVDDLALYGEGRTADPLAARYMEILGRTRGLVFIYPVWCGVEPAIVQGFYDKVFLKDFAWEYDPDGRLSPLLNITKARLFTTSEAPSPVFTSYFQDYLPSHVFSAVGIHNSSWLNLDNITHRSRRECEDFLAKVADAMTSFGY